MFKFKNFFGFKIIPIFIFSGKAGKICAYFNLFNKFYTHVKNKKLAIASDHAGYFLKGKIKKYLIDEEYEIKDFGSFSDEKVLTIQIMLIFLPLVLLMVILT